jgi:hypothetical protein
MATVRGTFDLNSRPASSALRDLRKEGVETDAVFEKLGKTLDGVGTTKQREQVRLYREAIKKLGTQWEKTATKADASWTAMEKKTIDAVATQSTAIDSLQGRLNELGRTRATAEINTSGIAESLAEVELLKKRLNELDRMRPTARVNVGGTGLATARSATGGGGGSGLFGRGLKIPFAGSTLPLIAGALGAAPPLLGGAGAVLGSAGAATLGAGAIGLGGLGALSAGIGSIAAVAIPAVKGLKESYKALTTYNKAVATNGKNSTQAHTALEKLNAALQSAPGGTRGLINREQKLSSRFQRLTKPGQSSFIGSLSNLLGAGNQLTPQLAGIANPFMAAGQRQSSRLSGFLTGGTTRGFLGAAGNTAISVLPDVESTFQNVLATLMNISRAAMPFFKQSVEWLETWTSGWRGSTGDIDKTRTSIGGMVSQLKTWGRLTSATFKLMRDLFSSGAKPGQSLVGDLTQQLNTWDAWIKKNPRQVRAFFSEAVESTEKIAGALGNITGALFKLGQMLTPLLTQLSQFVSFLSSAGLLEGGGLPLLLASGAGIRNVVGSARGRILGRSGAAGAAGGGLGEAAILGGALGAGGAGAARGSIFSRASSRLSTFGRVPVTGGMLGSADLKAMGLPSSRFSTRAAAGELGTGLRAGGGTFLRGAGARFLPIAALMGGLSAASFPGSFGNRFQAGLSGLTAGLVEMPKTGAQKEDEGTRKAQLVSDYYGEKYGGNLKGLTAQVQALRRKRHRLLTPQDKGGLSGFLTSNIITGDRQQEVTEESRKEAEALMRQMEQVRGGRRSQAMEQGGILSSQFAGAFNIKKQKGGVAALEDVTGPILRKIKDLGPAGGRVLAQNVLHWAKEAKRQNPKLAEAYETLLNRITGRFEDMGRNIEIINGRIYTGSNKEWKSIAAAMSNPIEQARQEMSASFTAIQREAIGALTAMGFSRSQAKSLIRESEKGGETGRIAKANMNAGPVLGGNAFTTPKEKKQSGYEGGPSRARGGRMRIPGYGNTDHVPMSDGGLGAPGELIVNPHTEARADRFLGMFGTTLEQMQKGEKYRASTPVGQMYSRPGERARGGRMGAGPSSAWRGVGPAGLHSGIKKVAGAVLGQFPGLSVTSTTGGSHVSGSYHYLGEAVDIGGSTSVMDAAAAWIKKSGLYRQLTEGIHNPNLAVSDGHIESGAGAYGGVWAGHLDHIHLAVAHAVGKLLGLGAGSRGGMRGGGMGGRSLRLHGKKSGLGGVPGALAEAGSRGYARALEGKLNKKLGRMGGRGGGLGGPLGGAGGSRSQVERAIAQELFRAGANRVGAAGIIGNAYAESSMDPSAEGTGGGGLWGFTAGAISLANLKKAGGRNWADPRFQTRFMLAHGGRGLIPSLNKAGTPEAAARVFMEQWERPGIPRLDVREGGARLAFKQGYDRGGRIPRFAGWFGRGGTGTVSGPTLLGVGERPGGEDVEIRPHKPERKRAGGRGRTRGDVHMSFAGAHFHVRRDSDIDKIADAVGRKLVEAIAEDDGVDQEDVIG